MIRVLVVAKTTPVVGVGRTMLLQSQYLKMPLPQYIVSNSQYGLPFDGDMAFSFEFEPWTYLTSPLDKYLDNSKYFRIHPETGKITLPTIDYESAINTYVLGVKITDGGGLSSTMNVTITIGGVQEQPVFGYNTYSLDEAIKGRIPQFTTTGFKAVALIRKRFAFNMEAYKWQSN